MDDICDQGPMHCMNLANRIKRMEIRIEEVIGIIRNMRPDGDDELFKALTIGKLQAALMDLQEETVTEPAKPMKVGWKCWENDGIEVRAWSDEHQAGLKRFKDAEGVQNYINNIPALSGSLLDEQQVLCGGMFGFFPARIKHENGLHAESEHYIFPIKWSERQRCWVTSSQINKACFNRINIPIPPGAKEDRETSPADITASVRSELEGISPDCRVCDQKDGCHLVEVVGSLACINRRRGIV